MLRRRGGGKERQTVSVETKKIGALHPSIWGAKHAKLISYVDEFGHGQDRSREFLGLAGLVAAESRWKEFDGEWRRICEQEGITQPFHMKDFAGCREQFEGWQNDEPRRQKVLGRLVQAVRSANAVPIGSVLSVTNFKSLRLEDKFRAPYLMAFQPLTYNIAVAAAMQLDA